MPPRTSDAPT